MIEVQYDQVGTPNSVVPPTTYLTFGPWIYMVPQYRPYSILMLGFAGGTTAGLIRLLYGNIPITAVDIEPCYPSYDVEFIQAHAREFVKTCRPFDSVIIDLFPNDSQHVCDFVTTPEFTEDLSRIADYIILNTVNHPDLTAYERFRCVGMNSPSKLGNKIYYYMLRDIPNLRPLDK